MQYACACQPIDAQGIDVVSANFAHRSMLRDRLQANLSRSLRPPQPTVQSMHTPPNASHVRVCYARRAQCDAVPAKAVALGRIAVTPLPVRAESARGYSCECSSRRLETIACVGSIAPGRHVRPVVSDKPVKRAIKNVDIDTTHDLAGTCRGRASTPVHVKPLSMTHMPFTRCSRAFHRSAGSLDPS